MLRKIGTLLLLACIYSNAFAQLPHPNDTLGNGKKVSFNQFLGRFSVYSEFAGAGLFYSLNVGYTFIKTDKVYLDATMGANRIPIKLAEPTNKDLDTYMIPVGLRALIGRRRSRLGINLGYTAILQKAWKKHPHYYEEDLPEHHLNLSVGYHFQHQYGFFFGLHAYLIVPLKSDVFGDNDVWPHPGLTVGYRLPSKQLHRQWTERGFKRRVLRLEQPIQSRESQEDLDDLFYNDTPLAIDSLEVLEIEKQLAKLKKRHDRYLKEEARLNGRSLVSIEGFGAAGIWSVNYSYTHPIAKSNTFMMEYGGGIGTDQEHLGIPLHIGVKAMKNYRGTGLFLGVEPAINWNKGTLGAIYFIKHNVEFHFAYGFSGGVAFYMFFDPSRYKFRQNFAPYAGVFLGYRLPQLKKS